MSRLLGFPQAERYDDPEHRSTLGNPSQVLVEALTGGTRSDAGELVNQTKALGIAAVFSAVLKISEKVGELPFKVYRVSDDDERQEARGHRSYRMLHDKPNVSTIAHTFWSTCAALLLLDGNFYAFKTRSEPDGTVDELWPIANQTVEVYLKAGEKRFDITGTDNRKRTYTEEDVLHIVGFSLDGFTGVSRIKYARETLGIALARNRFEAAFYRQGGRGGGVIEYPGKLGEQGTKNLADTFRALHGGASNAHKVAVLEQGAKFNAVTMSLEDMQFVEGAQLSRSEIAMLFDLPAAYLNASTGDSLTYATTESNQIQFATMAVSPLTNRIARTVSNDPEILPQNVMYAEFMLEALMRGDMKTRAEYWASMKQTLGLKPEYIAARENIPLDALAPAEPAPAAPPKNGNGNGNGAVDLEHLMATATRSRYSVDTGTQPPGVTFADGAIQVATPPVNVDVHPAPTQTRRIITFPNGSTATIEEDS